VKGGKKEQGDPFDLLLAKVRAEDLRRLVSKLASSREGAKRECLEFIEANVSLTPLEKTRSDTETAFALWLDLEFGLGELDEYGGGDCETVDHVGFILTDLSRHLCEKRISREDRRELLEQVLPYIRSGNSGLIDGLYEVAYAACPDEADLRAACPPSQ